MTGDQHITIFYVNIFHEISAIFNFFIQNAIFRLFVKMSFRVLRKVNNERNNILNNNNIIEIFMTSWTYLNFVKLIANYLEKVLVI